MRRLRVPDVRRPTERRLREINALAWKHKGQIAAVDPESGQFFLGPTVVDAVREARKAIPGGIFYFIRIGHRTAHVHHGGPRRTKP